MKNPAIQLFGNRFFSDQTHCELLIELLLVIFSPKKFKEDSEFKTCLPEFSYLQNQPDQIFQYAPKARLNLKLFSFLGASKLDARHKTHRDHHLELIQELKDRIEAGSQDKEGVIRTLENLFLGFQGAGSGRGWCAQSFVPISAGFLGGETIWKETQAKINDIKDWEDLFKDRKFAKFFDMSQHLFLARGGESLYLQLCNALSQSKIQIKEWADSIDLGFTTDEKDPEILHQGLEKEFQNFKNHSPSALTEIAEFIDSKLDPDTPEKTDWDDWDNGEKRFVDAGWCRTESWREGYIFAVEIHRLLRAGLDIVDRIHLLEIACAMQVLRSLGAQTSRITERENQVPWPGYRLALSAPADDRPDIRRLSQISVKTMEKQIYQGLRNEAHVTLPGDAEKKIRMLKQADKSYGGKLFISMSKRIGLMIPKMGPGARFVLNERLLRFLVITMVPLGGRYTLDTFKQILENRHGLVLDADGLDRAGKWMNGTGIYLPADTDQWLQQMLEAAGFLIQLSDSCALVSNPAEDIDKEV